MTEYVATNYTARKVLMVSVGINPTGPVNQFHTVLGHTYVYCTHHQRPEDVTDPDLKCAVGCSAVWALNPATYDEAVTEARERGFHMYREPQPCRYCGQTLTWRGHQHFDPAGELVCAQDPNQDFYPRHRPVAGVPAAYAATLQL